MTYTVPEYFEQFLVCFRVQDYNPFPFPGLGWVKQFEENNLDGHLGDPEASGYHPTWMKDDWNVQMENIWKFAGDHGFYSGGEWRLDPIMYENMGDPESQDSFRCSLGPGLCPPRIHLLSGERWKLDCQQHQQVF